MKENRDRLAEIFGANLQRCRKASGVTQEGLALSANLHRTEIGLLERGGRIPRIDTLVRLAGALDVAPEDLLKGMKWSPAALRPGRFE